MQQNIEYIEELWRLFPHSYAEKMSHGEWKAYEFLKIISVKIAKAIANGGGKIIVEVPPQFGKSTLISHWTPIWFLDSFENKKVILATYQADFAAKWARGVRNEINQNPDITVKVSDDNSAADSWTTTKGGGMHSAGVGGSATGRGGHLIIIDDPTKNWDEAKSFTYRERTHDWFKTTIFTRGQKDCVFIVLQTRWHEDDLAGRLQKEGGWDVIRFPALAEENDILGREVGESLCPDRFDVEKLLEIKQTIGSRFFSALYQQAPTPSEGELFKRDEWDFWDVLPEKFDEIIQSWDMTFKDTKQSDYVVGQVWGRVKANYYLIDQVRDKMSFTKSKAEVVKLTARHPMATVKLIEDKANGTAIIDTLKEDIDGIIAINPTESKYARASSVQPLCEAGNVFLPNKERHPWVNDFIEECTFFPNGKHDDQVDAMSQALTRLKLKNKEISFTLSGMNDLSKSSTWRN
jgi:predicted phage terminase large subunit-like protein